MRTSQTDPAATRAVADALVLGQGERLSAVAAAGPDTIVTGAADGQLKLVRVAASSFGLGAFARLAALGPPTNPGWAGHLGALARGIPSPPAVTAETVGSLGPHRGCAALAVARCRERVVVLSLDERGRLDASVVGEQSTTSQLDLWQANGDPKARPQLAASGSDEAVHVTVALGRRLFVAQLGAPDSDGTIALRSAAELTHPGEITAVELVAWDGPQPLVAVGDAQGRLCLYQPAVPDRPRWEGPAGARVEALRGWRYQHGGRRLAAAHDDGTVVIWRVGARRLDVALDRRSTLTGPAGARVMAVGPGIDDSRLLAAAGTSEARVWDLHSPSRQSLTLQLGDAIESVALVRPSSADVVAAIIDRDGKAILRQLEGTSGWCTDPHARREAGAEQTVVRAAADRPYTGEGPDVLGFARYADALTLLIENQATGTPLTVAIDGPWGSGKTSLGRMVERRLAREEPLAAARGSSAPPAPITCWFDAWMNDGGAHLSTALASAVVKAVDRQRPWWYRLLRPIDGRLLDPRARRGRRLRLLLWPLMAAVVLTVLVALAPDGLEWLGAALEVDDASPTLLAVGGASVTLGLLRALPLAIARAGATVAAFVRDPVEISDSGSVSQVREELRGLLSSAMSPRPALDSPPGRLGRWWRRRLDGVSRRPLLAATVGRLLALRPSRRFVLFVDNLDRCRPERAVEGCETLDQLLDHDGVVTVLMVDVNALAIAAEVTFKEVAERVYPDAKGRGWGRAFLEKLVQFDFSLPAHTPDRIEALLHSSMAGDHDGRLRR